MTADDCKTELTPDSERNLVTELAKIVLEQAAPEELAVFEETADEYFEDPQAVLEPRRRDEAVGFGLELALLTPYVFAVVTAVVRFLVSIVADAVREESKPLVVRMVHRLFRQGGTPRVHRDESATPLNSGQTRRVREIAYERARGLGLAEGQATLLADSVVGGLVVES